MARNWRDLTGIQIPSNNAVSRIIEASPPQMPAPFFDAGLSGKIQVRETIQRGRIWTETYQGLTPVEAEYHRLIQMINLAWATREVFEVEHPNINGKVVGSTVTSSIQTVGAPQSGTTINVTELNGTLLAGSIVRFTGRQIAYDITEDAPDTATQLKIYPPILEGEELVAGLGVQYNAVKFNAVLHENLTFPNVGPGYASEPIVLRWREVPNA